MTHFELNTAESLRVSDEEIFELLSAAYVNAGYTTLEKAQTVFEPAAVRKRGKMICARSNAHPGLAGMIIIVEPDSIAKKFAKAGEAELHLLAVAPACRGQGLGRKLVEKAIDEIRNAGFQKILLWTQPPMTFAQKLYASLGFVRKPERDFQSAGRDFLFYEKSL